MIPLDGMMEYAFISMAYASISTAMQFIASGSAKYEKNTATSVIKYLKSRMANYLISKLYLGIPIYLTEYYREKISQMKAIAI